MAGQTAHATRDLLARQRDESVERAQEERSATESGAETPFWP